MTSLIAEWVVAALIVLGGIFGLIGSFGLVKLKDPMQRLHAPTKAATLGLAGVLTASALDFWVLRNLLTWQEFLVTVFIIVTAPMTAFFLSKLNLLHTVPKRDLPPTGTGDDWATFTPDPSDSRPLRERP